MPGGNDNVRGTVHGRMIRLETDVGLPEGQPVIVSVQPLGAKPGSPGQGVQSSAGAWADDMDGLEAYLKEDRLARKLDHRGNDE
jgi:hypothetical protein